MGEERESGGEAPFNMAIATLQRLDTILQQIRNLNMMYPSRSVELQKAYIGLVQQFFINATPLFDNIKEGKDDAKNDKKDDKKDDLKNLETEILELSLSHKRGIKSGTQISGFVYDDNKQKRLNEILIILQRKLKKFFMPGKREQEGLI